MTFIDKKCKVFLVGPKTIVIPVRSEARLKSYFSTIDTRAWSDTVEERRQHILEYSAKNKEGFCLDKFIPLEIIFNIMVSGKNTEIKKLRSRMKYLEKCIDIYSKIELTQEQKSKRNKMKLEMKKVCGKLVRLQTEAINNVIEICKGQHGEFSNLKPICRYRMSQVNAIKSRYYTADNEMLIKFQQGKLCIPFPRLSDKRCLDELKDSGIQVIIEDDKRKTCTCTCCTETESCHFKKDTRCTCTNTCTVHCKNKQIETVDEHEKFAAQHHDEQKCCNEAISCEIICPHKTFCLQEVTCLHEIICSQELMCPREFCPHEEEFEIKFDHCCWQTDSQEETDICLKEIEELGTDECQAMTIMKCELEDIRQENKMQLQIAQQMVAPAEKQLQNIFSQSECVKCTSEELETQYHQWNDRRCRPQPNDVFDEVKVHCNVKSSELPDLTDSECSIDLEQELEIIEKEKEKLKDFIRQIQDGTISDCLLDCLKSDNMKLQEQLEKEIMYRKYLEQMLNNVLN